MNTNLFLIFLILIVFLELWKSISQRRILKLAESTHVIVNSQRSKMLLRIAKLTRVIADLFPNDQKAQEAAVEAEQDAEAADRPRRVLI